MASTARAFQRLVDDAGLGSDGGTTPSKIGDWNALFDQLITSEDIREVSQKLFTDRHYARAAEEAFKCLNNVIKKESGLADKDGAPLMQKTFGGSNPIIRFSDLRSQSKKDEQQGYAQIYAGAMIGIRNPRVHEHKLDDTPEVALALLVIANHLMCKLNDATKCNLTQKKETVS